MLLINTSERQPNGAIISKLAIRFHLWLNAFTDRLDLVPIDDVSKFLAIENHVSVLQQNRELNF